MATQKRPARGNAKTTSPKDPVLAYARGVGSGRIVAGSLVRQACARHLRDLKHGKQRGLKWDLKAALRAINFFPDVLRLAEGEFAGKPFVLSAWECFVVGALFGWKGSDGYRRFRTAYVEIGKGNGKTPLAAGVGIYMLVADGEAGAQCYAAAVTRDQAHIMFQDAVSMVDASPELDKRISKSGDKHVYNLAYLDRGSFFRPVSSEGRGLDGKRVYYAGVDELHEHPSNIVVRKMRQGTKNRRQALIFEITNSGFDRNSVCWHHHQYSVDVLSAKSQEDNGFNDSWFAYVCTLDPCKQHADEGHLQPAEGCSKCDDPLTKEQCWIKANPNLGISVSEKYLRELVLEANGMPSSANLVRRLNFCQWTESFSSWISKDKWDECQVELDLDAMKGRSCHGGIDLSGKKDLTATAWVFESDDVTDKDEPIYDAFVEFWTPGDTLHQREKVDKVPYSIWKQQGHIHAPAGSSINYKFVAKRLGEITQDYDVQNAGFDRARIEDLQRELDDIDVEIKLEPHGQGFISMGAAVDTLEELILNGRIRIHRNPCLTMCSAAAVLVEDPAGNRKFTKQKSTGRIDGVVALAMAANQAVNHPGEGPSVYEERGLMDAEV